MKKITLLSIALYLFINCSKAQSVDLKIKLISPTDDSYHPPQQPFNFSVVIKNIDSTAFSGSDSLAMYLLIDDDSIMFLNNGNFENFKAIPGIPLNQNDSFVYTMPFAFDNSFADLDPYLCILIKPLNRKTKTISDPVLTNNKNCATVHVKKDPNSSVKTIALSHNAVTLYPNPANTSFSILSADIIQSIKISNLQGQIIECPVSDNTIHCSQLAAGIYFVSVTTPEGVITQRIMIGE